MGGQHGKGTWRLSNWFTERLRLFGFLHKNIKRQAEHHPVPEERNSLQFGPQILLGQTPKVALMQTARIRTQKPHRCYRMGLEGYGKGGINNVAPACAVAASAQVAGAVDSGGHVAFWYTAIVTTFFRDELVTASAQVYAW